MTLFRQLKSYFKLVQSIPKLKRLKVGFKNVEYLQSFGLAMEKAPSALLSVALETVLGTLSSRHICDLKPGRFTVFRQVMSDKKEGPFP